MYYSTINNIVITFKITAILEQYVSLSQKFKDKDYVPYINLTFVLY